MDWTGVPGVVVSPIVKKVVSIDVPVDKYPNVCATFFSIAVSTSCFMCYANSNYLL
jgi:hypothetical protein